MDNMENRTTASEIIAELENNIEVLEELEGLRKACIQAILGIDTNWYISRAKVILELYERFEKGEASDRDRHMGNTINYLCGILESPENNSEEAVNAYSFIYGAAKGGAEVVRNGLQKNDC